MSKLNRKPTELHGESFTPEYKAWRSMFLRCNRADYASRGIKICSEWQRSYLAFRNHIGKRPSNKHSLDRINNNGNYEPGNVRWATAKEQQRNRRGNVIITSNGISQSIAEWAEHLGLPHATVRGRLLRGLPLEMVLSPVALPCGARSRNGIPFKKKQ